jgi:FKBP-type peptidyl-prolyl cis-trans isomerase FklB
MQKPHIKTILCLAASALLAGYTAAQQAPASTPPVSTQTPSGGSSAPPGTSAAPPGSTPAPAAKAQTGTGATTSGAKASGATAGTAVSKTGAAAKVPFTLKTGKDKQSYAIGVNIGKTMKRDGVNVDTSVVARGIRDALAGGKVLMTDEEIKATLTALSTELKKNQDEKQRITGAANKSAGEAFLATNKAKDGVVTLPSGLQYKIVKEGTGPKPTAADTVVCNYKGTLINGTEFDSSYKRGQAATFPVGGVIKGWTEALQLMPVGSKWELFVPSELAYGPQSRSAEIGPNSTLIFDVELLSIQPKVAPPTTPGPGVPPVAPVPPKQ